MKWARVEQAGQVHFGQVRGARILLGDGDPIVGQWTAGVEVNLASVKLLVPVWPRTFYAAGFNYADHVIEQARIAGTKPNIPEKPDIGYRANNALIASGEAIVKPTDAGELFQYEGELVAVIGRTARHVSEAEALAYVFGYTIGNDVSERTWQNSDRTLWRAKNTDTFSPMGPWIETDVDLAALTTTVRLNGRQVISFKTNNMLFGVARYISAMSRYLTLYPGDVIWMGAEGDAENMVPGDLCEVEISGIGTLSNPVVAEG